MTVTSAAIGFGTIFAIESATPGTYTSVGEVTAVVPPSLTRETVDGTHMASAGRVREFIGGLRDGGEASIELNYVPGGAAWDLLKAAFDDDDPVNYKITFPNAATVIFPALVTELTPASPLDNKMVLSGKFKLSGAPTWS